MSLLTASHLVKRYKERVVLRDVSVSLGPGEIVGLFGPNGAGKSTCFYMLLGLVMPDGGSVTLGDSDITYAPLHVRAKLGIGYLPQEASIFRKLSVEENILSVIQLRKNLSRNQRAAMVKGLLKEFGLRDIRKSMGMSLSGGERRRVEVARALAMEPRFILLDEPFAGVDPVSIHELQRMVLELKAKGIGVLITDHNIRDLLPICDRSYVLHDGTIIAEGPKESILSSNKVKSVYLGSDFRIT